MKQRINVLHLISCLNVGGMERLIVEILNNKTTNSEINNSLMVLYDYFDENLRKKAILSGLKCYFLMFAINTSILRKIFIRIQALWEIKNIIQKNNVQIVHTHEHFSKIILILYKLVFNRNLKIFYSVHCIDNFKKLSRIDLFLHKHFVDMNIAISKAVYNDCLKKGIKNVAIVYNGINIDDFKSNKLEKKSNSAIKIIDISRIQPEIKGQDVLIKALSKCKKKGLSLSCDFVGGKYYPGPYLELQELVKKSELENEVSFLGNRNDIPELMAQSDLFILPSRKEGFGLVIVEAMAAGLPIISSNVDGPAELIKNGENGLLFESENYLDLADKISYLYNNREEMSRLAHNAFKSAEAYDISIMCQKYCGLYKKIVEG